MVGAGHAGCEAALAAARMGGRVALLTINLDTVAQMSCNPAIGGLAKAQLVREVDALGGEMARAIDSAGIQFRMLNTRKGPAVQSNRAQADKRDYALLMKQVIENQPGLELHQAIVDALWTQGHELKGVVTQLGEKIPARTVVLTTGTFLKGLIHVGLKHYSAGRAGEPAADRLSESLASIGLEIGRLKTGTTPRLDANTIDFEKCQVQHGDPEPVPFSFDTDRITQEQEVCWITHTTERTHEIIMGGLDRSPLYSGLIEGIGPRYCPSIEDKVVKFPDRKSHTVFLEPEGRGTREIYPNGIPTSLPIDVQKHMVESIPGLEKARIMRPGYAIEYDFVNPVQLMPSLETSAMPGLFHAGQINGTSGYEEAAAQGIIAGINAMLKVSGEEPVVLDRSQGYTGVLIDDLVTKGTAEPYRMFTSRAEYRLLLREDNADLRLRHIGHEVGLVTGQRWERFLRKRHAIERELARLRGIQAVPGDDINRLLEQAGSAPLMSPAALSQLLKRPEIGHKFITDNWPPPAPVPKDAAREVEVMLKYEGYIKREQEAVERFRKMEEQRIPPDLEYHKVPGLRAEVQEKLARVRPLSLGQAMRIPGVTPAAASVLQVYLRARAS